MSNTPKQTITTYYCTGCSLEHSHKAESQETASNLKKDGYKARHNNQGEKRYIKALRISMCDSCNPHYFN